jgi:hypothetical protein
LAPVDDRLPTLPALPVEASEARHFQAVPAATGSKRSSAKHLRVGVRRRAGRRQEDGGAQEQIFLSLQRRHPVRRERRLRVDGVFGRGVPDADLCSDLCEWQPLWREQRPRVEQLP